MNNGDQFYDHKLPQDLDAERAVLGSMLHGVEAASEARAVLVNGAVEFALEKHMVMYDAIRNAVGDGEHKPDGLLIKDHLERRGKGEWERLGEFSFLADLLSSVPSALRVAHYARLVHARYLERCLIMVAHRIRGKVYERGVTTDEMLSFANREISALTESRSVADAVPIGALIGDVMAQIDREDHRGLETGWLEVNRMTGGLQPGELIIIAGRPGMGKTAWLCNLADHLAVQGEHPVLLFSLEMTRDHVARRFICSRAGIPSKLFRHRDYDLTPAQRADLQYAEQQLRQAGDRLLIDDSARPTVGELCAKARVARRKYKIECVMVDYLQLVRGDGRFERRDLEVGSVAAGLKALAKDLDIPVVVATQLRRPQDPRHARPTMAALRESGEIEQVADVIALLHREAYYERHMVTMDSHGELPSPAVPDEAEVIFDKQRNDEPGAIKLRWVGSAMRFDNWPGTAAPEPRSPAESEATMF